MAYLYISNASILPRSIGVPYHNSGAKILDLILRYMHVELHALSISVCMNNCFYLGFFMVLVAIKQKEVNPVNLQSGFLFFFVHKLTVC